MAFDKIIHALTASCLKLLTEKQETIIGLRESIRQYTETLFVNKLRDKNIPNNLLQAIINIAHICRL
jgi:hypothetical protein